MVPYSERKLALKEQRVHFKNRVDTKALTGLSWNIVCDTWVQLSWKTYYVPWNDLENISLCLMSLVSCFFSMAKNGSIGLILWQTMIFLFFYIKDYTYNCLIIVFIVSTIHMSCKLQHLLVKSLVSNNQSCCQERKIQSFFAVLPRLHQWRETYFPEKRFHKISFSVISSKMWT